MPKLYDFWRSSAAYRVRIGLNLKGLAYKSAAINLAPTVREQKGSPYLAINAQGRVPALETDAGMLTQSLAILEWLDETHPTPPLLPDDPWMAAQVRAFALAIACEIHPLNNVSVLGRLRSQFEASEEAINDWVAHWITVTFEALEKQLAAKPEQKYCFGVAPTLADLCLVPQCYNARRFKVDLSAFPRLAGIDERARAHRAFAAAAPEKQSDAP